jgi:SAM-dependent methyltransferase
VSRPRTRWELADEQDRGYGERFARLVATGEDVEGEARLADALAGRGARILDVGSGMGRVAAALVARGHEVVAVEPDASLVAQSRATYPDLEVQHADILAATLEGVFDLVVAVGNVMVFLAEDTERAVLARLRSLLAPRGRVLVGYHLLDGPVPARDYPPHEFVEDAAAAGLRVEARFGSYELHPPSPAYAVWLLARA